MIDLLYGIRISAEISFVLSQFHGFDRQADGRTDGNLVPIPPSIVCCAENFDKRENG